MIQNTLNKYKKLVWPEVKKYLKDPKFPSEFAIPARYAPEIDNYWNIVKDYPIRQGKYLRPTLVLLTAEAMGAKTQKAIKTAAAMQLSEEWLLIHDDIQDDSEERRGKKTLHKLHGVELAINAGDTLSTIMWKVLMDNHTILEPQKTLKIMDEFYNTLLRTEHGQAVEVVWTKKGKKIKDDDWFFIADGKTSYYSMALPLRLGALIAKANKQQINKLTKFGLHLGRCFQLVDDILDIEQDKLEGKMTIAKAKGTAYARALAESEKQKALNVFEKDLKFLSHQPARNDIKELVEFILERKY
ncbi:polyprenyl synthetase family protein [Patescibacteria group bacterium]